MSMKPWVGVSEAHQSLLELIDRVARLDVELLFCGETGVGKEHYARYAHEASARSSGPFISVNCGSIPTDLFENELFGHVGGAFTGARARAAGLVEAAEGGTLFFDEVDSLAPTNQVKLLRLLQQKEYRRLGDARAHHANARVVAATNRDLLRAVRAGQFREDLLFRLRVVPIEVPPLRERRDDILPLLDAFRDWYAREYGLQPILFTPEARVVLRNYRWPGNIRELENLVRNLTCVGSGRVIEASQLPLLGEVAGGLRPASALPSGSFKQAKTSLIAEFERKYLEDKLAATGGNIAKAARAAGKPRRAFFELMRKYGISSSSGQ
ncbi:MAG TPA: sigma-54 dependent transcriptional regulator [Kofleriaceae bacterium]|nr:sigma-54 dependent transcriptional regulator [Kofleriaceae bacterium]